MVNLQNLTMTQIPNLLTLSNLWFGCLAIVTANQIGFTFSVDNYGHQVIEIPEKLYYASAFIAIAAIIDFLDGFVARLFKATSEMGKQLDSLADVVSFGVAPAMIIYQFLRLSLATQEGGLDASILWLAPAFIIPCAGAYRLGRFNLDDNQSVIFKGLPIPAAGLLIASIPLIYWFTDSVTLFRNLWFWYAFIFIISYLMVSTMPMLSLKLKDKSIKSFLPFIIIAVITASAAILFGWLAVPAAFIAYVILSLLFNKKQS